MRDEIMTDEIPTTVDELRAMLRSDTVRLSAIETEKKRIVARRNVLIKAARVAGATPHELAADTGKSVGLMRQVAPRPVPGPVPLADADLPERFHVGRLTRMRALVSDVVTDRYAPDRTERQTIFVHVHTGEWAGPGGRGGRLAFREHTAAELLAQIPPIVERVYLVGDRRPGTTPEQVREHGSEADAVRGWFMADVAGWTNAGHYLADLSAPVGQWQRADGGRTVEVARAAVWFGEGSYGAAQAYGAWELLRTMMAREFPGGVLMSSPSTTGRDLWRRTIGTDRRGKGKTYPVLSAELRELIQSTSGQGRREIMPGTGTMQTFTQYDMRFAYSALTWGMPVGAPERLTEKGWGRLDEDAQDRALRGRGRWLIRATVPGGWDRVGILPAPSAEEWVYPRTPGQTFTTWASGSEVELARRYGWRVDVLEGMRFAEGKPLDAWKNKLVALHTECEAPEAPEAARLVRTALHAMLLTSIGAFASRTHMVSRSAPMTDAPPTNLPFREAGGMWVWEEPGERSEWMLKTAHPEWSAEIWGRCRARLLEAPTGTPGVHAGALHVPAGAVVGMRTDALYLATDPGWPDDGTAGRYRIKGRITGAAWPTGDAELERIKADAAAALEGEK